MGPQASHQPQVFILKWAQQCCLRHGLLWDSCEMMCIKEPYGERSINFTCLLWLSIEQYSTWSLNLFCYRTHSTLMKLHLSPCSAQYIMLWLILSKEKSIDLQWVSLGCSHLSVGLPFRFALSHLLIQDNSPLELSTQLRSVDFEGCTKSTLSSAPLASMTLALLSSFFLSCLDFCLFSLLWTSLPPTSAWNIEIPRLGLGLSYDS